MKLLCALAGHEPCDRGTYNSGYYFGTCKRCGGDVMRAPNEEWREVPEGYRVVWKAGRHCHALPASFEGALPMLHPGANLPAVKTPFVSWNRNLLRLRVPGAHTAGGREEMEERSAAYPYPRLVLLAVALGAGIQFFFDWVGADRSRPATGS
jgi:hypothetical protein